MLKFLKGMKWYYIVAIIIVILVIAYFVLKPYLANVVPAPKSGSTANVLSLWKGDDLPLKMYSSGPKVKQVQDHLNWRIVADNFNIAEDDIKKPILNADEKFGTKTKDVLKDYYGTEVVNESLYNNMIGSAA